MDAYGRTLDEWLAYYERLGISAVAYGGVVLRRRTTTENWVRVDPLPAGRLGPASDQIRRVFAAQDRLQGVTDDRALLDERFRVAETVRITQTTGVSGAIGEPQLSLAEGLGFQAEIDENTPPPPPPLTTPRLPDALPAPPTAGGIARVDRQPFLSSGPTLPRRRSPARAISTPSMASL